jgi:hypothetical protein
MTPIERTRAKASALKDLGLGHYAEPEDIREAWRQIVFRTHPDRNTEAHGEFARAKAAYDFLRSDAAGATGLSDASGQHGGQHRADRPRGAGIRPTSRPSVTTRTEALAPETIDRCRALLALSVGEAKTQVSVAADHVPDSVQRHGRHLTYLVRTPLARGRNRVALPTALLEDARKVDPAILTFLSTYSGAGDYQVPEGVRIRHFRGARSVTIRFEG